MTPTSSCNSDVLGSLPDNSYQSAIYLFDESLNLVYKTDIDAKRYTLQKKTEWIAAVSFGQHGMSYPILYENIGQCHNSYVYKRSSFLPEMVGKRAFLDKLNNSVLLSTLTK